MMMELKIAQDLIRIQSFTPHDRGCFDRIKYYLPMCQHEVFHVGDTTNALITFGSHDRKHFAFAGHIDVVPVAGQEWSVDPFDAIIKDGYLYGRGSNDMKGAIACFMAAFLEVYQKLDYKISFLLTSDEEGKALYGTREIIKRLKERNESIDLCLIGEPTSQDDVGDHIKIGSRGSINFRIRVKGQAGHVAYPDEASNPIPVALTLSQKLNEWVWDQGSEHFQASHLEMTSIDVNNLATNVIPEHVDIRFNIRFNDQHTHQSLHEQIAHIAFGHELHCEYCGVPYWSDISKYQSLLEDAVYPMASHFSTYGAASDGFMIQEICPCFELGLFYNQAHQKDERVLLTDLTQLKNIYKQILLSFSS